MSLYGENERATAVGLALANTESRNDYYIVCTLYPKFISRMASTPPSSCSEGLHPSLGVAICCCSRCSLLFAFRFDADQKKRLLLYAHGGELCSRALSIYDNDLGVTEVMDPRGQATSLVRLALLLEEQVG